MLRHTYFIAATLLFGLVSFALGSAVPAALELLWAAVVGCGALLFVHLIDAYAGIEPSETGAMAMAGAALALSGALKWLVGASTTGWHDAVAVLIGMAAAWGLGALVSSGKGHVCFVCKLPIGNDSSFACPRCHQTVCARPTCWMARHFRCRLCDERDVIAFPIDERWWKARLGARVFTGACASCYKEANEADLRECGRCKWPMCKRCWDHHNGKCTHCGWVMPGLPPALEPFMMGDDDGGSSGGGAPRAPLSADPRNLQPAARRRS